MIRCLVCNDETQSDEAGECETSSYQPRGNHTIDCEGGWCEAEFKRGSDYPYTRRCVKNDPTKEKVTWSPYALINKEKGIWCQWPAFG